MQPMSVKGLRQQLIQLRATLEKAFGPDTAMPGSRGRGVSGGQCAASAAIVYDKLGGCLVSTRVEDESHWFNRLRVGNTLLDVDITGDQWGRPAIQIADEGELYEGTRVRVPSELNSETLARARKLAARAGIELSNLKQET